MRLFVAIDPGPEVVRRIEETLAAVAPKAPSAKWVKTDSLHVTLAFLGERDPADVPRLAEALARAAATQRPFDLEFRGGGAFGRARRPRILWAGCEGDLDALNALYRAVVAALQPLGFEPDRRDFSAHLTLARSRSPDGDASITECIPILKEAVFGQSRIDRLHLYESRLSSAGPRYLPIASPPLAAPPAAHPV